MRTVRVKCVFVSPVLFDRMTDETLEELQTGVRAKKPRDLSPREIAIVKVYRETYEDKEAETENGPIGMPQEMLFSCSVAGGRNVKNGKKQISTLKTTTLPDFMTIQEFFIPLTYQGKPVTDQNWIADRRRGRLDNGVAICITRPKFPAGTEFEFTVEYDETKADESVIKALVTTSGSSQGIGSFRPNCKGPFGRFRIKDKVLDGVEGWEVIDDGKKAKKVAA